MDTQTDKELKAIATMIKLAEENGLLVEVIRTFASEVKHSTIMVAANSALIEWDI